MRMTPRQKDCCSLALGAALAWTWLYTLPWSLRLIAMVGERLR